MRSLQLSAPNRFMLRASVCSYAPGRFLHVIQIPATFDDFPRRGFASVRELGRDASLFIAQDVERFWQFLATQPDCRLGVTVLLLSGWGTPKSCNRPSMTPMHRPNGFTFLFALPRQASLGPVSTAS